MKQQPLPPTAGASPFYDGPIEAQVDAWVEHINQAISITPVDQPVVEIPPACMQMSLQMAQWVVEAYAREGWGRPCYEMYGPDFIVIEKAPRGLGFLLYRPLPEKT